LPLNLFALFHAVMARGGLQNVIDRKVRAVTLVSDVLASLFYTVSDTLCVVFARLGRVRNL
jgi:hypothetical protein